jgi:hypothetical protein
MLECISKGVTSVSAFYMGNVHVRNIYIVHARQSISSTDVRSAHSIHNHWKERQNVLSYKHVVCVHTAHEYIDLCTIVG